MDQAVNTHLLAFLHLVFTGQNIMIAKFDAFRAAGLTAEEPVRRRRRHRNTWRELHDRIPQVWRRSNPGQIRRLWNLQSHFVARRRVNRVFFRSRRDHQRRVKRERTAALNRLPRTGFEHRRFRRDPPFRVNPRIHFEPCRRRPCPTVIRVGEELQPIADTVMSGRIAKERNGHA